MRLKKQFIIIWILVGVTVTLGPFYEFLEILFLKITLALFCLLSILVQFFLQRKLFDDIHGAKSWERFPLRQFKNELTFSLAVGFFHVFMFYIVGLLVITTSHDLNKFEIYGWIVGLSQPFMLNFLHHLFYLMQQNGYLKKERQSFHQLSIVTQKKTLQDLVSPHFLFNSLNTAASIASDAPEEAVEFVNKLSGLYEFILKNNENELIELGEELGIVKKYVFLIQTRFGEFFSIDIKIPMEYYKSLIPPLTLQNLVENAVKHNAVTRKKPLNLTIITNGDYIIIENNLNPKKTFKNESTNLGLNYIKTQIEQFSPHPVNIIRGENIFRVEIPLIYPSTI